MQLNVTSLENAKYVCGLLLLSQNTQTLTKYIENNPEYKHIFDKETKLNYSHETNKIIIQ
jgi:hypothetical protein